MPLPKGIAAVSYMAGRVLAQRGGLDKRTLVFDRTAADALATWRDPYLDSLNARNFSPFTVLYRRNALNRFFLWAAERDLTRAGQVTRPILESYQRWLWKATKPDGARLSWSTQGGRISSVKDYFRWLTRQNVILHNPASELEMPREEKRLPRDILSQAEVAQILAVPNTADPLGVRDRAMLELFYSTGLRRMELCRLEMGDVHATRATLTVRQGKGKKDRMVPLGERALHWLERYLRETRPLLCLDTRTQALFISGYGEAFHPNVVTRMVSTWLQQALPHRKGSCHLLRHTCATHMLENGADIRFIQKLLGHESLETTAIYADVSIKQLQEVHARCHPAARLAGENTASTPAQNQ
jgi:integrase/recombinase XerD